MYAHSSGLQPLHCTPSSTGVPCSGCTAPSRTREVVAAGGAAGPAAAVHVCCFLRVSWVLDLGCGLEAVCRWLRGWLAHVASLWYVGYLAAIVVVVVVVIGRNLALLVRGRRAVGARVQVVPHAAVSVVVPAATGCRGGGRCGRGGDDLSFIVDALAIVVYGVGGA